MGGICQEIPALKAGMTGGGWDRLGGWDFRWGGWDGRWGWDDRRKGGRGEMTDRVKEFDQKAIF